MNKTNVPKNPKLPLSSTSRKAFERRYQELFLREAEKGISDEKLMKSVNDYESKSNPNSQEQKQEGIQDQVGNVSNDANIETEKTEGQRHEDAVGRYVAIAGVQPMLEWSTEEMNAESLRLENLKEGSAKYFDLFGMKPIDSMTNEQIFNAIETKEKEIAKAKEAKKEDTTAGVSLETGQVLAKHKVTGESRVFNAHTLKYLNDWEETPIPPKELKK